MMLSDHSRRWTINQQILVLILVLMDDALWYGTYIRGLRKNSEVLILVLMDDALWFYTYGLETIEMIVLILVLMDDALWFTRSNAVHGLT